MLEIWKNYKDVCEVSNLGNVRSIDRMVQTSHGTYALRAGKLLKQSDNQLGYLKVNVTINGKSHFCKVHRLVCETFVENPRNLPFVNHIDGNKYNNEASNLNWVSREENTRHAKELGLIRKGSNSGNAVLHESDIPTIRLRCKTEAVRQIASDYGVDHGTISQIKRNATWKHVL
jgi:hypothetical protein